MNRVDIKELLDAGVHFGHRTQRWNPKMKPYIFEARNGIYVIDLEHSVKQLETAQDFLRDIAASGKKVLFVGCKKQAQETIKDLAKKSNSYYVTERWLGGTMTNLTTIRKSGRPHEVDRYDGIQRHDSQDAEAGSFRHAVAKTRSFTEISMASRTWKNIPAPSSSLTCRARRSLSRRRAGCTSRSWPSPTPTPTPDLVDYPIAGNDDAIRSITVLLEALNDAVIEGSMKSGTLGQESVKPVEEESLTGVSA